MNFIYPPKPNTLIPTSVPLNQYYIQPKWRGWRILINRDGDCFTRMNNKIDIQTNYPRLDYDYQLDGEIISTEIQMEYHVAKAIKKGTYEIKIFDIYIPSKPDLKIEERLAILKKDFGIDVPSTTVSSIDELNNLLEVYLQNKMEGLVMKKRESTYRFGLWASNIQNEWIKVKTKIYNKKTK